VAAPHRKPHGGSCMICPPFRGVGASCCQPSPVLYHETRFHVKKKARSQSGPISFRCRWLFRFWVRKPCLCRSKGKPLGGSYTWGTGRATQILETSIGVHPRVKILLRQRTSATVPYKEPPSRAQRRGAISTRVVHRAAWTDGPAVGKCGKLPSAATCFPAITCDRL
jgi:hypothetical protein